MFLLLSPIYWQVHVQLRASEASYSEVVQIAMGNLESVEMPGSFLHGEIVEQPFNQSEGVVRRLNTKTMSRIIREVGNKSTHRDGTGKHVV